MRICVAESDLKTRLFLNSLGHEMEFASCRNELLSVVEKRPAFDAILVDAKMVLSDTTLLRQLRTVGSVTPIIVMFGPDEKHDSEKVFWGEAHAFVRKPTHIGKLKLILSRLSECRTKPTSVARTTRRIKLVKQGN